MYNHFGVSSKLANGIVASRHEFTIESLFPDIHTRHLEDLRSPIGTILTIDTTTMEQHAMFINHNNFTDENEEMVVQE